MQRDNTWFAFSLRRRSQKAVIARAAKLDWPAKVPVPNAAIFGSGVGQVAFRPSERAITWRHLDVPVVVGCQTLVEPASCPVPAFPGRIPRAFRDQARGAGWPKLDVNRSPAAEGPAGSSHATHIGSVLEDASAAAGRARTAGPALVPILRSLREA